MHTIDTSMTFGQWVQKNREAQEWTQEQLGARVCYSIHMIRKIETDQARPADEHIPRFAEVFGVPARDHEEFRRWAHNLPALPPVSALGRRSTRPAPPRSAPALPQWPGTLVGRDTELAVLTTLLTESPSRLLTVTGLGGVGKTRLAVQAAREVECYFPDGVWFVDLAAVAEPAGVLPQIARTLGVAYSKRCPALRQVTGHLRAQQALLVLDGADHLIAAAAQTAALLTAAPQITILVTSRRPLHIYSEQVIAAGPLALPAGSLTAEQVGAAPAGQLFVARARAVCPGFTLDDTTAPLVATICTRLAGLPLAIELAADRLRGLPLAAVLAQIDKPYTLLTDGALGLPARQQSLRASMDWSYHLLTPEEQTLLRRLAVFPAGGTLEEIAAVCTPGVAVAADLLDRLATLVTHNLLQVETHAGGDPRYRMPALVQIYAADLLAADPAAATIRQRYTQFSEQRLPQPPRRARIPKVVTGAHQPLALRSGTNIRYDRFFLTKQFSPPIGEAPDPTTHLAQLRAPAPIPTLLPDEGQGVLSLLRAAPLYSILHNQAAAHAGSLPCPTARAPARRTRRRRPR